MRLRCFTDGQERKVNGKMDESIAEKFVIEVLPAVFSVCKVLDYAGIDMEKPFVFTGCTDSEKSLVCPVELVPGNAVIRDDGWRAFRIRGELDFSLIGILARISAVLADHQIGIFAISTYNTDYILTKAENYEKAIVALERAGYPIENNL